MPLPRTNGLRGEYVRLYCPFEVNGKPSNPIEPPTITIGGNTAVVEHGSSSTSSTSEDSSPFFGGTYGPYQAAREANGLWYLDWLVPDDLPLGQWYDTWSYRWRSGAPVSVETFAFGVSDADPWTLWKGPAGVHLKSDAMRSYMTTLSRILLYEAQHIPVIWEQGIKVPNPKLRHFHYGLWNDDPRPLVKLNTRRIDDGWHADWNGNLLFDRTLDPEDVVHCFYTFRYFSDSELIEFLNFGLSMMNSVPPAAEYFSDIGGAPVSWRAPILAAAAFTALQRLIFGLEFQDRRIIFGEDPADWDRALNRFQTLYEGFKKDFETMSKNTKTLRWPGIAQIVQPEYTLPGGRSRWFRLLFKGS